MKIMLSAGEASGDVHGAGLSGDLAALGKNYGVNV